MEWMPQPWFPRCLDVVVCLVTGYPVILTLPWRSGSVLWVQENCVWGSGVGFETGSTPVRMESVLSFTGFPLLCSQLRQLLRASPGLL